MIKEIEERLEKYENPDKRTNPRRRRGFEIAKADLLKHAPTDIRTLLNYIKELEISSGMLTGELIDTQKEIRSLREENAKLEADAERAHDERGGEPPSFH